MLVQESLEGLCMFMHYAAPTEPLTHIAKAACGHKFDY